MLMRKTLLRRAGTALLFALCGGALQMHAQAPDLTKLDWAQFARYKAANEALPPLKAGENRVVFFGDSITDGWNVNGFFPGRPYVNRGISGQTTPQMLVRFRADVINLHPKVVVILAGTNDVAGNTGIESNEELEGYLTSMAELATANHIRVVMCSILPVFDYRWRPGLKPASRIDAINAWMKEYASAHGHVFVDYHSAMKDERDGLPEKLSSDGVHPTDAGYHVMMPLVEQGIIEALK